MGGSSLQRRSFRALVAAAAGSLAAIGFAVPALATSTSTSTATPAAHVVSATTATTPASISGDATVAVGHMQFTASNVKAGSTASTGTFSVAGDLLPVTIPGLGLANTAASYALSGPVTCLDVQGNRAGLVYPITSASGSIMKVMKGLAMYITVQASSPGHPAEMGFVGPAPINSLQSCPPLVTSASGSVGERHGHARALIR